MPNCGLKLDHGAVHSECKYSLLGRQKNHKLENRKKKQHLATCIMDEKMHLKDKKDDTLM